MGLDAERAQAGHGAGGAGGVDFAHDDGGAGFAKGLGAGVADPLPASGHDRNTSVEAEFLEIHGACLLFGRK